MRCLHTLPLQCAKPFVSRIHSKFNSAQKTLNFTCTHFGFRIVQRSFSTQSHLWGVHPFLCISQIVHERIGSRYSKAFLISSHCLLLDLLTFSWARFSWYDCSAHMRLNLVLLREAAIFNEVINQCGFNYLDPRQFEV